jgi:acyl-CoA reductase-like NAD-dependent aldehyde dehydrogenase
MRLYVEPMDAVVVEVSDDGRVRYAAAGTTRVNEAEWSTPTLQERRAILYAAKNEIAELNELLEALG